MYKFLRLIFYLFWSFLLDFGMGIQVLNARDSANLSRVKVFARSLMFGNAATSAEHMDTLPITTLNQSYCWVWCLSLMFLSDICPWAFGQSVSAILTLVSIGTLSFFKIFDETEVTVKWQTWFMRKKMKVQTEQWIMAVGTKYSFKIHSYNKLTITTLTRNRKLKKCDKENVTTMCVTLPNEAQELTIPLNWFFTSQKAISLQTHNHFCGPNILK